jgi:hypothetical protein
MIMISVSSQLNDGIYKSTLTIEVNEICVCLYFFHLIFSDDNKGFRAFDHPDTVVLLHTSGTSRNKKVGPYSLDMIVIGVGCIFSSWTLTPIDVCLSMMPLFLLEVQSGIYLTLSYLVARSSVTNSATDAIYNHVCLHLQSIMLF